MHTRDFASGDKYCTQLLPAEWTSCTTDRCVSIFVSLALYTASLVSLYSNYHDVSQSVCSTQLGRSRYLKGPNKALPLPVLSRDVVHCVVMM